ncbi:MAG: hypothetical protein WAT66_12845 [Actinomycetota bacterium]
MADDVKLGTKEIRVRLQPSGSTPLMNPDKHDHRRGFLAGWYRLGFEVAEHITTKDAVEFSKWSRDAVPMTIRYKSETPDKEFLARLTDLSAKFLNGWAKSRGATEEPDEEED